jgi:hypothetical protein
MTTTYYSIKDGVALLARTQPGEKYRYLNNSGKWADGGGLFEGYFFNGEMAADEISKTEAARMAKLFGGTLEEVTDS